MRKPVHENYKVDQGLKFRIQHPGSIIRISLNILTTSFLERGIDSITHNFLIDKDGRLIDKAAAMKQLEKILSKL